MEKTEYNQEISKAIQILNQYKINKNQDRNVLIQGYQKLLEQVGPNSHLGQEVVITNQALNNQNNKLNQFVQGLADEYKGMLA